LRGTITSVLGERDVAEVFGPALSHEHLRINLSHKDDPDGYIREEEAVLAELEAARDEFGLRLVVELTCQGMGRDVMILKRLSDVSGVDVICATGFYYERFHPHYVKNSSVDELVSRLLDEIQSGIEDTRVRPGVIGEVGSRGPEMSAAEERCFRAAARAALASGLSIMTHAHLGVGAVGQLELLLEEGLLPERICLGHQDLIDDSDQHETLAEAGAYVAFDTVGKESYQPDEVRLRLLMRMLEAGHEDRLLLSNDISREAYLKSRGGFGYGHLFESFVPELRRAGVDDRTLSTILEENPKRFLRRKEAL
jgi:phosphotriesterase-related protein